MKVVAINNSPNYNGKIIKTGSWTKDLETVFDKNTELEKLKLKDKNVVAKMSSSWRYRKLYGIEPVYKLSFTSVPEKPTFMDKIKKIFGFFPSVKLSKSYHSEFGNELMIKTRINASHLSKRLKLDA